MKRYTIIKIVIIALSLLKFNQGFAQADVDTSSNQSLDSTLSSQPVKDSVVVKEKKKKPGYVHQARVGVDLARIPFNILNKNRTSYEVSVDYLLRNQIYVNLEGGFGSGNLETNRLRYTTQNFFFRLGVDKSLLQQLTNWDFDIFFFGARYGIGLGERSAATYIIQNPYGGGEVYGDVPSKSFVAHWGEIVAGIKVEIIPSLFLGWSFRAKFLINSGAFTELAPYHIAGYGKGDNATSFDFNFYLAYAIKWNLKQ